MADTRQTFPLVTRAGRVFYNVALFTALAVGGLQMFHVRGGLLTDYGADLFGTAWLYGMTRSGRTILQRGRPVGAGSAAAIVFVLCVVSEFGQKLQIVPGRFDPFDIAAYSSGVLACFIIDYRVPLVEPK
jgi:hypothetical protein